VSVSVRLPTVMRAAAGGQTSVEANSGKLSEVLEDLVRQFPNLRAQLLTDNGELHRFVNVYVDDEDVRFLDKLDTQVAEGAQVSIVPAVAGGQAG
jgi:sulfur-carrier protein